MSARGLGHPEIGRPVAKEARRVISSGPVSTESREYGEPEEAFHPGGPVAVTARRTPLV